MAKIGDKATIDAPDGMLREVFNLPGYKPLLSNEDVLWFDPQNKEYVVLPHDTKVSYQGEMFNGSLFKVEHIPNALFASAMGEGKYFIASNRTVVNHIAFK